MEPHQNDLPNMSLADRSAPSIPPPQSRPEVRLARDEIAAGLPSSTSSGSCPNVGDRVFATREPAYSYAGVLERIEGSRALVRFFDGAAGSVSIDSLKPLIVHVGQRVHCPNQMTKGFASATVRWSDGHAVTVEYDRGGEERTTIAALRIPTAGDIFTGLSPSAPAPRLDPGDSGFDWQAWRWVFTLLFWILYLVLRSIP